MNPPVSPQELREIAQAQRKLAAIFSAGGPAHTRAMLSAQALERWASDLEIFGDTSRLDEYETMTRQSCHTGKVERDYNGQVAGTLVTDSGGISTNADALISMAQAGRFRIVANHGRMVVGYWPENDPLKQPTAPHTDKG